MARLSLFVVSLLLFSFVSADTKYWVSGATAARPSSGLTLLDLKAHQQTTDYTCGPSAVLSLLRYFGRDGDEMALAKALGTNEKVGTTPERIAEWFDQQGFEVSWGEHGTLEMLRENLAKGIPTLVEWSDWGGHWVIAVGYDTRETPVLDDDIILFADPSDIHDDAKDGLTWFNAQRFDYMWYDALLFGKLMEKLYIVAVPGRN